MLTFEDDPFHSTPSPLSDIQPTDPPSDTDSFESYIDQSFCSNFSCCGQSLPDLHRLLEHFEDEHVLPISIPYDSRPLYSTPVYARPSGPHASYILSYPQPDPPLQPVSHPIPAPRPLHDRFHMSRIPLGPAPDLTYSSPASSCDSPPNHAEPLCLPPALFTFQNPQTRPRTPPLDYDDLDDDESDHSLLVSPPRARVGVGAGPHRSAKQARSSSAHARSRPVAPTHAPATAGQACAGSRRSRREGREKAYKCPVSALLLFGLVYEPVCWHSGASVAVSSKLFPLGLATRVLRASRGLSLPILTERVRVSPESVGWFFLSLTISVSSWCSAVRSRHHISACAAKHPVASRFSFWLFGSLTRARYTSTVHPV
ncbi:hypothetical protein C8Q74DRAFT_594654 [Fomes fomentarius]|nr:hypothetical protein C8Q74DRAFT_594654 [Fomes fomentarius]